MSHRIPGASPGASGKRELPQEDSSYPPSPKKAKKEIPAKPILSVRQANEELARELDKIFAGGGKTGETVVQRRRAPFKFLKTKLEPNEDGTTRIRRKYTRRPQSKIAAAVSSFSGQHSDDLQAEASTEPVVKREMDEE